MIGTRGSIGTIEIIEEERHRNGVGGAPFWLTMFRWVDESGKEHMMLATRYGPDVDKTAGGICTSVLDLGLLRDGCIKFTVNSWRGDQFESALRAAGSKPWEGE